MSDSMDGGSCVHIHHRLKHNIFGSLKGMLSEAAVIIFAVLAALAGEGLWEHHQTQKAVEIARDRIAEEVMSNYTLLHREYAEIVKKGNRLATLDSKVDNSRMFLGYVSTFDGYSALSLRDVAWKRATADRLSASFNPAEAEALTDLYENRTYLETINQRITEFLYSELMVDPAKAKSGFQVSMLYYLECERIGRQLNQSHYEVLTKYFPEKLQKLPPDMRKPIADNPPEWARQYFIHHMRVAR